MLINASLSCACLLVAAHKAEASCEQEVCCVSAWQLFSAAPLAMQSHFLFMLPIPFGAQFALNIYATLEKHRKIAGKWNT
jgi:hypothetical protein